MDQNEFRSLKESGGLVDDAGLREAATEVIDDQFAEELTDETPAEDTQTDAPEDAENVESDEIPLSPKEKTAFEKRLEREKAKLEEKIRREAEQEYEQKYSKHKEAIEAIGGDPDKILAAAREAKLVKDAQALADRNGWDDEQTQWYIEQQKQQQELKELRVQMQINKLRDNPEYTGIERMEREIMQKIDRSNGALSVEEAYWALGGPKRIEQIKLEAQQREIAKRTAPQRVVQTDSPAANTGEKPLPPSVLKEAERMGISLEEARRLMSRESAQNIDEYRKQKQKVGG